MSAEKLRNNIAPSEIKGNITNLGNSISESIGSNVNNVKKTFRKKQFDSDDELISQYQHDLSRSIKALKYILGQIHRLGNVGFPKMFKLHMKSVEYFSKVIGADSLKFEGIEEYYHEFDRLQTESEIPFVHPKEKEYGLPAVNEQIFNYMMSIDLLTSKTIDDWDLFYQENKLRVVEMNEYLKGVLKLISKRNKKQHVYEKLHKKVDKLMKKTTKLEDKEQKQLVSLEKDLKEAKYIFEKLDEKTKTLLPHVFLLLEEFIDSLSKILFCKQVETFKAIYNTIEHFAVYYGLISAETYEGISEEWENAMTPIRLQLETFISIIHDKNPEIIDEEIDNQDKTLKANHMWNKVTKKMTEKTLNLKVDERNGLFNGHLIVDPLDAFAEYHNPNVNRSETYFPTKKPKKIELPKIDVVDKPKPPPLPPRQNTAGGMFTHPIRPISLPSTPSISSPISNTSYRPRNIDRVELDSDTDTYESDSILSANEDSSSDDEKSLLTSRSLSTAHLIEDVKKKDNARIMKIYNSNKNNITQAPVYAHFSVLDTSAENNGVLDKTSSLTHKLDDLFKFFDKALALESSRKTLTAKYDFQGQEPGDLSFSSGAKIDVAYEFHNFYDAEKGHWLIGSSEDSRTGLVPSNYFI